MGKQRTQSPHKNTGKIHKKMRRKPSPRFSGLPESIRKKATNNPFPSIKDLKN